jgi:hypothetical protein
MGGTYPVRVIAEPWGESLTMLASCTGTQASDAADCSANPAWTAGIGLEAECATADGCTWSLGASFTMATVINRITPSTGSLKGGTVVTIDGEGFADFGPYNKIEIGGQPCIPKTFKNLECRKDAVSMGYACNKQYEYAYAKLHIRQDAEWFDFSK